MPISIYGTRNNDPPQWFFDTDSKKTLFSERDEQKVLREKRKAKAAAEKKERERLEKRRREQKRLEEKHINERLEKQRRANEVQGRIRQLTSRVMADKTDSKARSELSYAKTQLFWINNVPAP